MKHTEWCNCTDLGIDHYEECTCGAYYDVILLGEEVVEQRAKIEQLQKERDDMHSAMLLFQSAQAQAIRNLNEENEQLQKCCTQRGARMQILWEYMNMDYAEFISHHPEARDWFDKDGVPK